MVFKFLKDLALNVFEDKHSIGTSPDNGLQIYFSASFHFEFNANPSCANHSLLLLYIVFACNAATNKRNKTQHKLNTPFVLFFDLRKVQALYLRLLGENLPLSALVKEYVDGSISSVIKDLKIQNIFRRSNYHKTY